jgi:hypothetical protein
LLKPLTQQWKTEEQMIIRNNINYEIP